MFRFSDYSEYHRHEQELARRAERRRHEREIREDLKTRGTDRDAVHESARPAGPRWLARARWA